MFHKPQRKLLTLNPATRHSWVTNEPNKYWCSTHKLSSLVSHSVRVFKLSWNKRSMLTAVLTTTFCRSSHSYFGKSTCRPILPTAYFVIQQPHVERSHGDDSICRFPLTVGGASCDPVPIRKLERRFLLFNISIFITICIQPLVYFKFKHFWRPYSQVTSIK